MAKRIQRKGVPQKPSIDIKQILKGGILLCLIFCLFYFRSYFTLDNAQNFLRNLTNSISGADTVQEFTFIGDSRNQYLMYRDRLVVMGVDGVTMFDPKRSSQTTIPMTYQKPAAQSGSRYMLCYDAGGTELKVVRDAEVEETLQMEGTLLTAAVNDSGVFAVVTSQAGYKGMVDVYNNSRENFYKLYSNESILDLEISPLSGSMSMLALDTQEGTLKSRLLVYDFNKEEPVGRYEKEGSLFLDLQYKDSNLMAVVGEDGLYYFNGNGVERGSYDFGGRYLQHYDLAPQRYTALALSENKAGVQNVIRSVNNNGELQGEYAMQEEILDLCADDQNIYILTAAQLIVLNNRCEWEQTVDLDHAEAQQLVAHKNGVFVIGPTWARNITV
jgi:hypothetical protein